MIPTGLPPRGAPPGGRDAQSTAFFITAVEIPKATIVGQFQPSAGDKEEFGMLFEKGSELVPCVNEALAELKDDGTLEQIQQEWLSEKTEAPVLQ